MSSDYESSAKEVTEDMHLGDVSLNDGIIDDCRTPIADKQPSFIPKAVVSDSEQENKKASSVETLAFSDDYSKTPPVPPRSKKRRVNDLRCSEVRWFYRKPGETKWTPFKGADSLILEVSWRGRSGIELDSSTKAHLSSIKYKNNVSSVVVLDGHYRSNEDFTSLIAIYWKDDKLDLRRGTWFLSDSLQPITPELAEPIEKHHLHYFRFQAIPDSPVFSEKEASRKPVLTELKLDDQYEVKWNSVIDVILFNTSKTSRFLRYISWGKGTYLRRGYEEASWDDGNRTISHLIFIVHGVGQKGYESLIARNTEQSVLSNLRPKLVGKICMLDYNFHSVAYFDYVWFEWFNDKTMQALDDGLTDIVTLPRMSTVRHMLNSTVMDIMYYQSPLYRKEIMGGLVKSLNTAYGLFIENHPDYSGPISLFAHSLGSVMCYDILTSWSPLNLYDKFVSDAIEEEMSTSDCGKLEALQEFQSARKKLLDLYGNLNKVFLSPDEQLDFKVANLFCVGSPLAVFLVMRGAKAVIPESIKAERIYNVFHPYDPVAYRLEPLVHRQYSFIKPVKLFSALDTKAQKGYDNLPLELNRQYIKKMKAREKKYTKPETEEKGEKENEDLIEEGDSDSDDSPLRPTSSCSSLRSLSPPPPEEVDQHKSWWKFGSSKKDKDVIEIAKEVEESKLESVDKIMESIPADKKLKQRMDFQVQPQLTERGYYSLLRSHFAYWTNADVAAFLVSQIYPKNGSDGNGSS